MLCGPEFKKQILEAETKQLESVNKKWMEYNEEAEQWFDPECIAKLIVLNKG